jgi:hypothetical protein
MRHTILVRFLKRSDLFPVAEPMQDQISRGDISGIHPGNAHVIGGPFGPNYSNKFFIGSYWEA